MYPLSITNLLIAFPSSCNNVKPSVLFTCTCLLARIFLLPSLCRPIATFLGMSPPPVVKWRFKMTYLQISFLTFKFVAHILQHLQPMLICNSHPWMGFKDIKLYNNYTSDSAKHKVNHKNIH